MLLFLPPVQLLQEVISQRAKRQWCRLETRVTFWKKCHEQLKADGTDPESASQFFLSQTEPGTAAGARCELLDVQERCLMLALAAHWLSRHSPAPVDKIEKLEKQLWISRVQQHGLLAALEKESVFQLPPPAVTPGMNTYEVLMKEFSFSNITELNTETSLLLDGLPGPTDGPPSAGSMSPEESGVLAALVGHLLDDGSIHEASRVCRYFSLYHPDMWVVLRCRGLASGELNPEMQQDTSEAPAGISSCKPNADLS